MEKTNTKFQSTHIQKGNPSIAYRIVNGDVEINFISEENFIFDNILKFQKKFGLASYKLGETIKKSGFIIFTKDKVPSVIYNGANCSLSVNGPLELFGDGRALYFLLEYMFECLQAPYTKSLLIHAAAVYSKAKDTSYLILGEKGSGKTTLSFRLCDEFGLSLIGNDLVRVGYDENGELFTKEGSRWFDVRETAIKADCYMGKLADMLTTKSSNSWNNKVRILPEEYSIQTHSKQSKIDRIFNIRMNPYQNQFLACAWEGVQRNLILHEKIGRHISGQATPFQDDYGNYLGSLPNINHVKASSIRDSIVSRMIDTGITELSSPDSQSLIDWLKREIL
ncbi:hypothetical protein U0X36_05105 [Bacillus thuringiensis]|uniref:hypothetical protein n=1 Tax=Bacillus thuringiensis TaxID=1428 RepID=UPI000ECC6E06|nr:hypothetical protein [Bacillus thuringiensis]MDZ3952328.1 hypothetical protein [Bacillus thuringiensis]RGP43737.1 hypothetical protein BTW32_29505 [Bacillus thuringiensis]